MVTQKDRDRVMGILHILSLHSAQLDYPPHDERGAADAATWKLDWKTAWKMLRDGKHLCFDCSQCLQQVFRWVDLQDPCGLDFAYAGDTGAMLANPLMKHYTNPASAYQAALVVYGPGRGEHVDIVIARGADPLLWGHGSPGAHVRHLSEAKQYHRPPTTFLSVSRLA